MLAACMLRGLQLSIVAVFEPSAGSCNKSRTTGVNTGRGAYGSLREPAHTAVSARVCLDLETADEEGRLPGCVLEENEGPTRRREAEGKHRASCADSMPVLQIPRRPKESPGGVVCDVLHVHRRRFVALLSCWASRAKSALTPHSSLSPSGQSALRALQAAAGVWTPPPTSRMHFFTSFPKRKRRSLQPRLD